MTKQYNDAKYIEFCEKFGFNTAKNAVYSYSMSGSSIQETIEIPPHMELIYKLFPDISVTQLFKLSSEIRGIASTWDFDIVHDYYDTQYPEFNFSIKVVDLYAFYLIHTNQIEHLFENLERKVPNGTYGIFIKIENGNTYYYAQNVNDFKAMKDPEQKDIVKVHIDKVIKIAKSRETVVVQNTSYKVRTNLTHW